MGMFIGRGRKQSELPKQAFKLFFESLHVKISVFGILRLGIRSACPALVLFPIVFIDDQKPHLVQRGPIPESYHLSIPTRSDDAKVGMPPCRTFPSTAPSKFKDTEKKSCNWATSVMSMLCPGWSTPCFSYPPTIEHLRGVLALHHTKPLPTYPHAPMRYTSLHLANPLLPTLTHLRGIPACATRSPSTSPHPHPNHASHLLRSHPNPIVFHP
jgi:hypothetical protein